VVTCAEVCAHSTARAAAASYSMRAGRVDSTRAGQAAEPTDPTCQPPRAGELGAEPPLVLVSPAAEVSGRASSSLAVHAQSDVR